MNVVFVMLQILSGRLISVGQFVFIPCEHHLLESLIPLNYVVLFILKLRSWRVGFLLKFMFKSSELLFMLCVALVGCLGWLVVLLFCFGIRHRVCPPPPPSPSRGCYASSFGSGFLFCGVLFRASSWPAATPTPLMPGGLKKHIKTLTCHRPRAHLETYWLQARAVLG